MLLDMDGGTEEDARARCVWVEERSRDPCREQCDLAESSVAWRRYPY